jgi:hypothetical protein
VPTQPSGILSATVLLFFFTAAADGAERREVCLRSTPEKCKNSDDSRSERHYFNPVSNNALVAMAPRRWNWISDDENDGGIVKELRRRNDAENKRKQCERNGAWFCNALSLRICWWFVMKFAQRTTVRRSRQETKQLLSLLLTVKSN